MNYTNDAWTHQTSKFLICVSLSYWRLRFCCVNEVLCHWNLLQNFITSVNKIWRFCLVVNGSYPEQTRHLFATCVKLLGGGNMQLSTRVPACRNSHCTSISLHLSSLGNLDIAHYCLVKLNLLIFPIKNVHLDTIKFLFLSNRCKIRLLWKNVTVYIKIHIKMFLHVLVLQPSSGS
jgi:hypothetical protein